MPMRIEACACILDEPGERRMIMCKYRVVINRRRGHRAPLRDEAAEFCILRFGSHFRYDRLVPVPFIMGVVAIRRPFC